MIHETVITMERYRIAFSGKLPRRDVEWDKTQQSRKTSQEHLQTSQKCNKTTDTIYEYYYDY
jgi:hypothetical protein